MKAKTARIVTGVFSLLVFSTMLVFLLTKQTFPNNLPYILYTIFFLLLSLYLFLPFDEKFLKVVMIIFLFAYCFMTFIGMVLMITLFLTGVTIAFVSVLVVFLIIFYLIRSEEEKYAKKEFNPALSPQPPFGNEALRTRQVRLVPPQSIERRLIEAKNLFEQGLITEEEYRATKSKILGL